MGGMFWESVVRAALSVRGGSVMTPHLETGDFSFLLPAAASRGEASGRVSLLPVI